MPLVDAELTRNILQRMVCPFEVQGLKVQVEGQGRCVLGVRKGVDLMNRPIQTKTEDLNPPGLDGGKEFFLDGRGQQGRGKDGP